eukprot:TRINITY_DN10731_c0_g2_i1.p1 TRINITY_DN10731_c0_g2~~TRINITY_DN10731_c0_g2_i1.p1  ORF type:complete len:140 (-),score=23.21 TRINITY_DN10731_c0_g2_i1:109-528(-)
MAGRKDEECCRYAKLLLEMVSKGKLDQYFIDFSAEQFGNELYYRHNKQRYKKAVNLGEAKKSIANYSKKRNHIKINNDVKIVRNNYNKVNTHFNTRVKAKETPKEFLSVPTEVNSERELLQITLTHMQEELKAFLLNNI